ncbi:MAG TPA: hypothetical protein VF744_15945 [Beijerinckiaceae bacterium]
MKWFLAGANSRSSRQIGASPLFGFGAKPGGRCLRAGSSRAGGSWICACARALSRTVICGLALAVVDAEEVRGQMVNGFATKFFLEEPPNPNQLNTIPDASDLTIAKVRLADRLTYLIGRDQSGRPPALPKDLFYAEVDIVQAIQGNIKSGSRISLYFGRPGASIRYKYPHTPAMMEEVYYIVFRMDRDQRYRIVGFSAPEEEYLDWDAEVRGYERP